MFLFKALLVVHLLFLLVHFWHMLVYNGGQVGILVLILVAVSFLIAWPACGLVRSVSLRPGALDTEAIAVELERSIVAGEEVTFRDPALLRALGRTPGERRGGTLWRELLDELQPELDPPCAEALSLILREGTLAARMLRRAGPQPSLEALRELVLELADCLDEGRGLHGR